MAELLFSDEMLTRAALIRLVANKHVTTPGAESFDAFYRARKQCGFGPSDIKWDEYKASIDLLKSGYGNANTKT